MTEAELVEMEKLAEAATPGPWRAADGESWRVATVVHGSEVVSDSDGEGASDGPFIAASRAFVPAAIAEIRGLRAENERLTAAHATLVDAEITRESAHQAEVQGLRAEVARLGAIVDHQLEQDTDGCWCCGEDCPLAEERERRAVTGEVLGG